MSLFGALLRYCYGQVSLDDASRAAVHEPEQAPKQGAAGMQEPQWDAAGEPQTAVEQSGTP
jgi:hypothetical protein